MSNHKHCHTHTWAFCEHCQGYYCSQEGCDEEYRCIYPYQPQPSPWKRVYAPPYTWDTYDTFVSGGTAKFGDSVTFCSHV